MRSQHASMELHRIGRVGWLRAAVLGANDGIVSTASLIVGVAASGAATSAILIAGGAGLVAGAMSMAAGEYVSVSSQADTETADLAMERKEIKDNPAYETDELTEIYVGRGLERPLALQVARQLMAHDALGAHARDELGIIEETRPRPIQAAFASAGAFSIGAILPLVAAYLAPSGRVLIVDSVAALVFLAVLGALGAHAGGAGLLKPTIRVTFWGALALAVTAGIGRALGTVV